MIPYSGPREATPILLVRLGTLLLLLAAAASLLASPDRGGSAPWAALVGAGAVLVWTAVGRGGVRSASERGESARGRSSTRGPAVARAALVLGYSCALVLLLLTDWPVVKLPALSQVYEAIPSLLPYAPAWVAPGISPNQTGGILAGIVALAAALFIPINGHGQRDPRLRALRRAAAPLLVVGTPLLVASGSRAALAGLVVAVVAGFASLNKRSLWFLVGAVTVVGALAAAFPDIPRELMQRFMHDAPLQTKLLGRADIWASALKGIADHPFAGIGPGALNQVLPVRYPYGMVGLGYTVTQAHNIVLDTALTMGVLGAIGVVCALAGGIWWGVRCARTGPLQGMPATLARAFTAPLVTFTVFGTTDALSFSSPSSLLFWASLAGLMYVTRGGPWSADHLTEGAGSGGQRDHGQAGSHGERLPDGGPVPAIIDESPQSSHQVADGVELGHGVEPVGQ